VSHAQAAELLALIGKGTISASIAKQVLETMLATGDGAGGDRRARGADQQKRQRRDRGRVDAVLAANADKVEQYKGRQGALFGFFVGQTMKAMQGKGQPAGGQRGAEGEAGLSGRCR
jgi:aspartyl-tRNA(Asn)/glutamyl-tRNA(Gln) amidotransferase subunit B